VISSDALNRHALDVCIVPISTVQHRAFSLRPVLQAGEGGLARYSWVKCDQVTTLEKTLIRYPPLGTLSLTALQRIEQASSKCLSCPDRTAIDEAIEDFG
jgi:mRNA-degrading endonuclease toxin of MazEF toxin-antitoxin module